MASNFTVIQFQRQHFGNEPGIFNDMEPNVPFVGSAKDFLFDCPNVDPAETAFLVFQSRHVEHQRNVFRVNGTDVFGGLPASPARDSWNGNILLLEPHHQFRGTGNVLHVESRNASGGSAGDVDDFIIDNVVIEYKTRAAPCTEWKNATARIVWFSATGAGANSILRSLRLSVEKASDQCLHPNERHVDRRWSSRRKSRPPNRPALTTTSSRRWSL